MKELRDNPYLNSLISYCTEIEIDEYGGIDSSLWSVFQSRLESIPFRKRYKEFREDLNIKVGIEQYRIGGKHKIDIEQFWLALVFIWDYVGTLEYNYQRYPDLIELLDRIKEHNYRPRSLTLKIEGEEDFVCIPDFLLLLGMPKNKPANDTTKRFFIYWMLKQIKNDTALKSTSKKGSDGYVPWDRLIKDIGFFMGFDSVIPQFIKGALPAATSSVY